MKTKARTPKKEFVKIGSHDCPNVEQCIYSTPKPFRRQLSYCHRKAVEGAKYCVLHICPCGTGPFTHIHNAGGK